MDSLNAGSSWSWTGREGRPVHTTDDTSETEFSAPRVFNESRWREVPDPEFDEGLARFGIGVSRWTAHSGAECNTTAKTPEGSYIVSVALTPSRVKWIADREIIFEGLMLPGTVYVSRPGQRIAACFRPPFDFLHFHADSRLLAEEGLIVEEASSLQSAATSSVFRDGLVEALCRSLIDAGRILRLPYMACVSKAIVMRAMARQEDNPRCSALPKWRLRKLENYLADNIGEHISLGDMAEVTGLSRMHFAAQFRAATGFRPREYLIMKRVEQAKIAMAETEMPLVEVALSVGFSAQAHFSTVFKRFTGSSPAQWKHAHRRSLRSSLA